MAGFFYFFPGKQTSPQKVLEEAGLSYLLGPGTSWTQGEMIQGPKGTGHGALARVGSPPPGTMAGVERAEWQDCGKFWLGFDPENPPTPQDLLRTDPVEGHDVRLDDGNMWMVPVARHPDGSTPLPRPVKWHPDHGYTAGEVVRRHRELFAGACQAWDVLTSPDADDYTVETEFDLLAVALGTNYRLGPAEIGALEILTTSNRIDVVKALVDWAGVEELVKKKERDAQPSTPGVVA